VDTIRTGVESAGIASTLLMRDNREIAGDYGSKPLYRNLGYFSLICLLRVHVLLGDPTRAWRLLTNTNTKMGVGFWSLVGRWSLR
jgi:hypothetical protein